MSLSRTHFHTYSIYTHTLSTHFLSFAFTYIFIYFHTHYTHYSHFLSLFHTHSQLSHTCTYTSICLYAFSLSHTLPHVRMHYLLHTNLNTISKLFVSLSHTYTHYLNSLTYTLLYNFTHTKFYFIHIFLLSLPVLQNQSYLFDILYFEPPFNAFLLE